MFKKFHNRNDLKTDIEEIIKNLENVPEIGECEYIFIDILNLPSNIAFLENKIIITQNDLQDFLMFEYDKIQNNKIQEMTKINFKQVVDLVILLDSDNVSRQVEQIIDQDTIISKCLGNNIIYIEDSRNSTYMIVTQHEKITLKQRGANTHIEFYKNRNTKSLVKT